MAPPTPIETPVSKPPQYPKFWFYNPVLQLVISIVLSAAAQVFLKLGADSTNEQSWFGISGLASGWTWLGIFSLIGSLLSWLQALRFIALNVAFNLQAATQVLVPLSSWIFLGEKVGAERWAGATLIVIGVLIIARPLMRAEEQL